MKRERESENWKIADNSGELANEVERQRKKTSTKRKIVERHVHGDDRGTFVAGRDSGAAITANINVTSLCINIDIKYIYSTVQ